LYLAGNWCEFLLGSFIICSIDTVPV
jgi:hypothetical protein